MSEILRYSAPTLHSGICNSTGETSTRQKLLRVSNPRRLGLSIIVRPPTRNCSFYDGTGVVRTKLKFLGISNGGG